MSTITCRQIRWVHSSVCQGPHTLAHPIRPKDGLSSWISTTHHGVRRLARPAGMPKSAPVRCCDKNFRRLLAVQCGIVLAQIFAPHVSRFGLPTKVITVLQYGCGSGVDSGVRRSSGSWCHRCPSLYRRHYLGRSPTGRRADRGGGKHVSESLSACCSYRSCRLQCQIALQCFQLRRSSKKPSDYLASFPPLPASRFEVLVLFPHCLLRCIHYTTVLQVSCCNTGVL